MAKVKIRYLVIKPGRGGAIRYFWQPSKELRVLGWRPERLPEDRFDAIRRADVLNADLDAWRRGEPAVRSGERPGPAPGTVNDLVIRYKTSRFYTDKAPKTRAFYDHNLTIIRTLMGDVPVVRITAKMVQGTYDGLRIKTPAKANAVIRVLRLLLQHGVREDMITRNPAASPGLIGTAPSGKVWPRAAVDLFVEIADRAGRPSIGTAVLVA
ncbi:MAG: phage integrase, partial [Rhodospirillaceae bacterium]